MRGCEQVLLVVWKVGRRRGATVINKGRTHSNVV